jgi:hypothetical protein
MNMVKIEGDEIVVRVKIDALTHALRYSQYGANYEAEHGEPMTVTDSLGFAKDVVGALEQEEEDGSTPVHQMLDDAMEWAIEQGSEHVAFKD